MDGQLREQGVGDVVVGKHIGKLMGTLGGRLNAYRDAMDAGEDAMAEAVRRDVTLVSAHRRWSRRSAPALLPQASP